MGDRARNGHADARKRHEDRLKVGDHAPDLRWSRRAGEGNRTLMTSLEGWSSTIELRPRGQCGGAAAGSLRVSYRAFLRERCKLSRPGWRAWLARQWGSAAERKHGACGGWTDGSDRPGSDRELSPDRDYAIRQSQKDQALLLSGQLLFPLIRRCADHRHGVAW